MSKEKKTVTFTINGKSVEAEVGKTILEAAKDAKIDIPHLCYVPFLEPYGACRVCLVEVRKNGYSTLVTSCTNRAEEGIEVYTDTEQVLNHRRKILKLLLKRAPHARKVRELAIKAGIKDLPPEPTVPPEEEERCILCGLCVRVCEEIVRAGALAFVQRGRDREVSTPFGELNEACITCGACAYFCPTEAIWVEDLTGKRVKPEEITLGPKTAIRVPTMQAVPNVPFIDTDNCIHFKTGGCKICATVCPYEAVKHDDKEEEVQVDIGAVLVATGFKIFDAKRIPSYGYGRLPNVLTSIQVEQLFNASGPTGGLLLKEDGALPKSVGIVHCVGSRDKNYNEYCSRVCCMYSLKLAHLVHERTGAEVYNFYIDMRTPGKGYEEFYHKLLDEGVHFIRGRVAEITDWAIEPEEKGKLVVRVEDTMAGIVRRVPVDMVILSVGLEPQPDAQEIRRLLNLSCSSEGFFLERHPKLAPVSTFTSGIYIAGACQGPKDIPDTVAQAGAAAGEILALVDKGYIELEPIKAHINEEDCSGCKMCNGLCPYNAITYNKEKKVSEINEVLCEGCGTCVAACPSGAIDQDLFENQELLYEIEGVLKYV